MKKRALKTQHARLLHFQHLKRKLVAKTTQFKFKLCLKE